MLRFSILSNNEFFIRFLLRSSNALFDLVWQPDGSVCFRANNGKYVATKRSGHLYANSDSVEESCKYFFYLINRLVIFFARVSSLRNRNRFIFLKIFIKSM